MIHEPTQQNVTCDGPDCQEYTIVRASYRDAIQRELGQLRWIVRDGKHFCSEECAETQKAGAA